jgi:hypothetical protein
MYFAVHELTAPKKLLTPLIVDDKYLAESTKWRKYLSLEKKRGNRKNKRLYMCGVGEVSMWRPPRRR